MSAQPGITISPAISATPTVIRSNSPQTTSQAALAENTQRETNLLTRLPSFGRGPINDYAWAGDGSILLVATAQGIYRHDPKTLAQNAFIQAPVNGRSSFSFISDGNALISYADPDDSKKSQFGIWDFHAGTDIKPLPIQAELITKMVASPDGQRLVVLSAAEVRAEDVKGSVQLWDLKTRSLISTLVKDSPQQVFHAAAFSPDGQWLAVGCIDDTIFLWNLKKAGEPVKLTGHTSRITTLTFSPDSLLLVSGGGDASVRLWKIPEGTPKKSLMNFKSWVNQVEISRDGHWLAASDSTGLIKLWELSANQSTDQPEIALNVGQPQDKPFAISPQSDRLAVRVEGTLQLWDITARQWIAQDPYYGSFWGSVAWSPDGKTLFGSRGDHVLEWDAGQGTVLREIKVKESGTRSLAVSPDGSLLAVTNPYQFPQAEESISIFDLHTGLLVHQLKPVKGLNAPPVFSPDGRWLAVSYVDQIGVWDPRSGVETLTIPSNSEGYAFSANGDQIITFDRDWSTGKSEIRLWDIQTQTIVRSIPVNGKCDSPLAVTQDGSLIAVVLDDGMPTKGPLNQRVSLYQLTTGELRYQFAISYISSESGLAFSADGSMLAISAFDHLLLVAVSNGEILTDLPLPSSPIAFRPDGNLLAVGGEILQRWDITTLHQAALENRPQRTPTPDLRPTLTPTITPTPQPPLEITPLPSVTSIPSAIRAENAAGLKLYRQLGKGSAEALAWSPDRRTLAVAGTRGVYLYDASTLREILWLNTGKGSSSIAFSPDGKQLAAASLSDAEIQLWDLSTNKPADHLTGYYDVWQDVSALFTGVKQQIQYSPDGKKLLFSNQMGYQERLLLWDLSSGQAVQTFETGRAAHFAFHPDGTYFVDNHGQIWNTETGEIAFTFPGRDATIHSMDWDRAGRRIALSYEDGLVQVWEASDPAHPELSQTFQAGDWATRMEQSRSTSFLIRSSQYLSPEVRFSPDGKYLAATSQDNCLRLWEIPTGKLVHLVTEGGVRSPDFSPDGQRLAAINTAGEIQVWKLGNAGELALVWKESEHIGEVHSAAFSQDGQQLIIGDPASFRIWDLQKSSSGVRVLSTFDQQKDLRYANVSVFDPIHNQIVFGYLGGEIRVWDASTGTMVKEFLGSDNFMGLNGFPYISGVFFAPGGDWMASKGAVGDITIWNTVNWEAQCHFFTFDSYSQVFSPNGVWMAAAEKYGGYPGTIHIFETLTGKEVRVLQGEGQLAISPDGVHLLGGRNWLDIRSGKIIRTFPGQSDADITAAAVNPFGDVLGLGRQDGVIEVWDVAQSRQVLTLTGGLQRVSTLSFSTDGRYLLAGNQDGSIQIWSLLR